MKVTGRRSRRDKLATPGQIAVRVRELRAKQGLTVKEVFERIKGAEVKPGKGVSLSYLYKLERGLVIDVKPYTYMVPGHDGNPEARHAGLAVVVGRLAHVLGVEPHTILSR